MATFADHGEAGLPVARVISAMTARWCAGVALAIVVLVQTVEALPAGSLPSAVDSSMTAGSAFLLVLLIGAVLAVLRGRLGLARAAGLVTVVLGTGLVVIAALELAGVPEMAGSSWRPAGHAATVHTLLGVALLATMRPSARLAPVRLVGLAIGAVAPLVSLSVHVVHGEGYALLPGVAPMSVTGAIATLLATCAIAALDPDRWPMRGLLRHRSDLVLVGRLLPFVLVVPFIAPLVVALARATGLDERPTIVLATLLPMLALCGLLAVTVRSHHGLLEEIEIRERQLVTALDGLPIAVMVRGPDGVLRHLNPGAEAFVARLGVGPDAIRGSASELMAHVEVVDEHGRPYDREQLPVVSAIRDGRRHDATVGHALPEGGYAWYSVRAAPLPLSDGTTGTIVTLDDVTERHNLQAELRAAASHDALTGLVNRRALAERLGAAQARRTRDGADIGVLFLDLDQFKAVNDTYGHETGDRLLVEVGRELLAVTRRSDTVCRMGGDEFVILCTPIDGARGLQDVLERLEAVRPQVETPAGVVGVGHSVGAVLVEPGEDLDAALRRADAQMYVRKRGSDDPVLEDAP
ncbi:MAG: diguanylate cyclase [Nitriliruptoraceae bacterium]|nr:diguanylate cyclase [Nitriliruptoraceae bacterium]